VQKTVDKTTIGAGQLSEWNLKLETSEYRYSNNVQIEDVLPDGLCPLGKEETYEGPIGAPTEPEPECAKTGNLPTSEYSHVEEQENGSFIIEWNETTVPQLKQMAPSTTFQITFPTHTRVDYQNEFKDEKPVLTGDHWVNNVEIKAPSFARCTPKVQDTCEGGGTHIEALRAEGETITDKSAAEQKAGGVSIDKTVRKNGGAVPVSCSEGEYVDGVEGPFPLYGPGDQICWKLRVDFNANLFSGEPIVTDFLPPEQSFVEGSIVEGPQNTVVATSETGEAAGGVLKWTINGGKAVESDKVFEFLFKTEMLTSESAFPKDITGNLMKFSYSNTEGETFPLRDQAEVERAEPNLQIIKGVYRVGSTTVGGEAPAANDENFSGAHGGEVVRYGIQVRNTGNLTAKEAEVWDQLPAGIECSSITNISNSGSCETGNIIVWKGVEVAAGETHTALTYEMALPTGVAPSQTYVNESGVTQFAAETNTGTAFHYYPSGNIDHKLEEEKGANTGPIKDPATVSTGAATLAKTRTTTTTQEPGNNAASQATIGEGIKYTLTSTIPAGSKLFGSPTITDPLGERLALVPGTVKGSVNGTEIPTGGFTVAEEGGNPVLKFPETYEVPAGGSEATIVLEFEAQVTDVEANNRTTSFELKNEGKLTYKTESGAGAKEATRSATATTTIVEPNVAVAKTHEGGNTVKPGDTVKYTVTAENPNGTRVSTANDSTVVDTVPEGMIPVNGTETIADGGTVEPDGGTWNEGEGRSPGRSRRSNRANRSPCTTA
jgi:fimbrial isopeptide formation D2 family protein/uncharacterized repeat protein (TIGR01451 family)